MRGIFVLCLLFFVSDCSSLKQETVRARLNEQGIRKLILMGIHKARQSILSSPIADQSIPGESAWAKVQNIRLLEVPDSEVEFNLENRESVFFLEGGKGKFTADVEAGVSLFGMSTTFNWKVTGKISFGSTVLRWYLVNPTLGDKNGTSFFFTERGCSAGVTNFIVDIYGGVSGVILDIIEPLFRPVLVEIINKQICKLIRSYILPQVNENLLIAVNDHFTGKLDRIQLNQQGSYITFATNILPKVNGIECSPPSPPQQVIWSKPEVAMLNLWATDHFVQCFIRGSGEVFSKGIEQELINAIYDAKLQLPGQSQINGVKLMMEKAEVRIERPKIRLNIPLVVDSDWEKMSSSEDGSLLITGRVSFANSRLQFISENIQISTAKKIHLQFDGSQKKRVEKKIAQISDILSEQLAEFGITIEEPTRIEVPDGHCRMDINFA